MDYIRVCQDAAYIAGGNPQPTTLIRQRER